METSLAYDNTKPWGDLLYEEEQNRKMAFLRMPQPEWFACVNAYFNRLKGNGSALISALAWFQDMEGKRNAVQAPPAPVPEMDEDTRNWRVWRDMVEDPEKYGSDIGEWVALDEEVRRGPKRWRVDAYWNAKVREIEEEQADAATRIQALWRGYITRYVLAPRFNCARCLKHCACPTEWDDPMTWICADCTVEWNDALRKLGEELEAEEEDACGDCGDELVSYAARMGDTWFCPACIHDWEPCPRCPRAKRVGGRCDNHCRVCGDELTGMGGGHGGFCCYECQLDYIQDAWRD